MGTWYLPHISKNSTLEIPANSAAFPEEILPSSNIFYAAIKRI